MGVQGKMRKIALFFIIGVLLSCPPIFKYTSVLFNRPGIEVKTPPAMWEKAMAKKLGLDSVYILRSQGVFYLRISGTPGKKPVRISTSVDLSPWFKNRDCARTWDEFHRCMNQRKNPQDEKLYRKIDREFYSKLICQEKCPDPTFALWEAHWYSPTYITISAEIGEGGFKTVEEARESLHRINYLLKKVVYGPRFPEGYGEGTSPEEIFTIETRMVLNEKLIKKAVKEILLAMKRDGYLSGLSREEIEKISSLSAPGNKVIYLPEGCPAPYDLKPGWISLYNSVRVKFGEKCPRITVLK